MSEQQDNNLNTTPSPLKETEGKQTEINEKELSTLHTEADLIATISSRPSDNFQPPLDEETLENERAQQIPIWLNIICFIAVLTMFNQIKLSLPEGFANAIHMAPLAQGIISLADIGFIIAFVAVMVQLFTKHKTIHLPWMAPAAIAVFAIANIVSRTGIDGAIETAQLAEQLFGGVILFAFMTKFMPRTTLAAVTTAFIINLCVAGIQYFLYGYYMTIAPADIKALPWGFGPAMTGLFRSRMAFSFFMATALVWCLPQWIAAPDKYSIRNLNIIGLVFALLVVAFFFIPYGQMMIIAIIAAIIAASFVTSRSAIMVIVAATISLLFLFAIQDPLPQATFLSTISPLKGADYVADASILFNRKTPAEPQEASEFSHELKSCHYDFIAALRMACRRPWSGIGSGRYQANIRRCYQPDLPSPPESTTLKRTHKPHGASCPQPSASPQPSCSPSSC